MITSADVSEYILDNHQGCYHFIEKVVSHLSGYLSEYTRAEMETAVDDAIDIILEREYWGIE